MIKCSECTNGYYNSVTKDIECGLSAENAFNCPNLMDED